MDDTYLWAWIIGAVVQGLIFGAATNVIIANKGYNENWFWWGFFFSFIALIVAAAKPPYVPYVPPKAVEMTVQEKLDNGYWKCYCGTMNPAYTGTCRCGRSKPTPSQIAAQEAEKAAESAPKQDSKLENLKLLNEYKQLLDSGVITEDEFNQKKSELL